RALHGDRCDDFPHDVVHVDAEDLAEQVLHPLAVHGEPDHSRRPYKRKLSMVPILRGTQGTVRRWDVGGLCQPGGAAPFETAGPSVDRKNKRGRPRVLGPACGLWRRGYWVG